MKVKIITTEKKLTSSIINQFEIVTIKNFFSDGWNALGYINNIRKNMSECILVEKDGKYGVVSKNHYKCPSWKNRINYYRGKTTYYIEFDSELERDEFWNKCDKLANSLEQIFI